MIRHQVANAKLKKLRCVQRLLIYILKQFILSKMEMEGLAALLLKKLYHKQ